MTHEEAIQALTCKTLPIEKLHTIVKHFPGDIPIEAAAAMNLSLHTSVHAPSLENSEQIVSLLTLLSSSQDMSVRWAVAKNPHTHQFLS